MHKPQKIFPEIQFTQAIRDEFNEYFFSEIVLARTESFWCSLDNWTRENLGLQIIDFENVWTNGFYLIDEQKYLIARLKFM